MATGLPRVFWNSRFVNRSKSIISEHSKPRVSGFHGQPAGTENNDRHGADFTILRQYFCGLRTLSLWLYLYAPFQGPAGRSGARPVLYHYDFDSFRSRCRARVVRRPQEKADQGNALRAARGQISQTACRYFLRSAIWHCFFSGSPIIALA